MSAAAPRRRWHLSPAALRYARRSGHTARPYDDLERSIDKYDRASPGFRAKLEARWAAEGQAPPTDAS